MNLLEIGIDIVSVDRVKKLVGKNKGFEERILSKRELKYCRRKKNYIEHIAGRFAAKEAVYKAVNKFVGSTALKDIEIISDGKSPEKTPEVSDSCLLGRSLKKKGFGCRVSISHNRSQAVANAALFKKDNESNNS
jgi:holo-[acyl-carrier protein] synthase